MPSDSTFRRTPKIHLQALLNDLLSNDRIALGKAITLIESKRSEDRKMAAELMDLVQSHTGKSFRIGISGVPGVGKSTFIERLGKHITSLGVKVAVLSIDPSSSQTRGSILGDKTRMTELSNDPNAFIRPTAAGDRLGGVASTTRETILLCEAAGYELVIVETVGVGQSETVVKDMVDYFLLLMLSGGGDELQGIKRGIMELTDHILINKADGDNIKSAVRARKDYKNALHVFPEKESGWNPPVELCSALENVGIQEAWKSIEKFRKTMSDSGWLTQNRNRQAIKWFQEWIEARLKEDFYTQYSQEIKEREEMISSQKISVRKAVDDLFKSPS